MSYNYSAIYYKNMKGVAESILLPTIQNISLPDNTCIPSKPTVTGEYRNQFVTRNSLNASFTIWLENGKFGEETIDVSETIDKLEDLKKNRILFNLSTSHEAEESRFLSDLVIENISYARESSHRDRLICVINCVQIKLVNLTWQQASAVEIFGHDIFTNSETGTQIVNSAFSLADTDVDFEISKNDVGVLLTKLGDISGFKDMPVNRHIRNAIGNKVTLDADSEYFKLTEPIDMSIGNRTINCSCSFTSRYGLGIDETAYTVDLGKFVVNVTKKDATIVENFPLTLGYGLAHSNTNLNEIVRNAGTMSSAALKNKQPTCAYPYDFADTYPDYQISKSFEYIEGLESLAKYLRDAQDNGQFTTNMNAASSGAIIVKNDYVWSYKISQRYDCVIGYDTFRKEFTPDGALKIETFELNTTNSKFKLSISNDKYQALWDGLFSNNYKVTVVIVSLGAMLQVFLFSPIIFNKNKINNNG